MSDLKVVRTTETNFTAETPARDWDFYAKWDGCVEVRRFFNGGTPEKHDDDDAAALHICDAGELMDQLFQLVQEAAKRDAVFRGEWDSPVVVLRRLIARLSPDERAELLKEGKP